MEVPTQAEAALTTTGARTIPFPRRWDQHLTWLTWEFVFSIVLTLVIGRRYLAYVPEGTSFGGWLATLAALVSTALLLNLVIALPLVAPVLALRRRWFTLGVCPLLFGLLDIFVYADTVIYQLFRFHVNGMVLNLLTTSGAEDSYTLGFGTVVSSLRVIALVLGAQLVLSLVVLGRPWAFGLLPRPRRLFLGVVPALFLVAVADKICFISGDLYNKPELTRARHLFPLYRPIVMRGFAQRYLGVKIAKEEGLHLDYRSSALRYPRRPIAFAEGGRRPNVVIVAIEGGRYDMLDPAVMPFLDGWSRSQLRFEQHYSGGNASRFGIFTLLYGIYGTYWHKVLAERQSPVMIGAMRRLGYDFRVLSGDNLNFPEFRKTAFLEIPSSITDTWTCERTDRDRVMTDLFVDFVDRTRGPFFSFLFYDGPHQPYLFPPEDQVFMPILDKNSLDYTKLAAETGGDRRKVADLLLNRYKNSMHYVDSQLRRLVEALEQRGKLDDTLIFITGDHGEEFNELGYVGHNSTFSRYQTRTLMVAHVPGQAPREVTRITSHMDVVPTVLTFMGATNAVSDFSQGVPMTDSDGPHFALVASWDRAALVDRDSIVVFGTETTNARLDVYDPDYKPDPAGPGSHRAALLEVMRGMSQFSR